MTNKNNKVRVYLLTSLTACLVTLYHNKVAAGFPSPAEEYLENQIDLIKMLVTHPAATYLVRAQGCSMEGMGIYDNDILIVDRSLKPVSDRVVIAAVDGQLLVKQLKLKNQSCFLYSANPNYPPLEIKEGNDLHIWGVVTRVIHNLIE